MATKTPSRQTVELIVETKPTLNESVDGAFNAIATGLSIEDMIADQLLEDIDWTRVKSAMLTKVKQRFFAWLTSGNNTPINISQFPELSALPSSQDGEAA